MVIHVVKPGDSIYAIALEYGVPMSQIISDNELADAARLAVGQALVVRFPGQTYTVRPGDTLAAVGHRFGLTLRQLYRNNPSLGGEPQIFPGQTLVLSYLGETRKETISVNGYAYPFIDKDLLQRTLPFLTFLTPFTYGITETGGLVDLDDQVLIAMAKEGGVASLMHLSTLTEEGGFSNDLAHLVLTDMEVQATLIAHIEAQLKSRGYRGLDVDFEFVFPEDALPYAAFLRRLSQRLGPQGYPVIAALAPKISADQPGLLYEGHNYRAIGTAVDEVLLMTYEWGYTYGLIGLRSSQP